ncbi:hypothetical protein RclHR1_15110003 [Rhizophagus clarus]|uniref:F-box domain-containing protein n=1 Tax=Rhizophagus clarus TaxID=94130 RepID=A0A2Z6QEG4_9GLOM|nr:hypothetical protein RclHR1_15110003 [Rhizophagus clarus]GES99191.1 hypothetical protein GLOIN_2v1885583 [Rhizophagus clarus]
MLKQLNDDIIFLILKELKDDNKTIYSCLFVNRIWCKMTVPILWNDPVKQFRTYPSKNVYIILFNVLFLHLSEKSRNNLKNQGIDLFIEAYQKPLFNYISYWKHLNLYFLESMMMNVDKNIEKSKTSIVRNELLNLFDINTKFSSLSIQKLPCSQILGNEYCFSKLQYFFCNVDINRNILEKLAEMNTSVEKLGFRIYNTSNNPGIIRLIEVQKNLKEVNFFSEFITGLNESYRKALEESLIKCSDTIQHLKISWIPLTKFLSNLVNLVSLEIKAFNDTNWDHLIGVSLPFLKFLKVVSVPSELITSLVESTRGFLVEIIVIFQGIDGERLLQAIYQNCPNLNYLTFSLYDKDILSFENLLINCQFLAGLKVIGMYDYRYKSEFNWNKLFEILTRSAPVNLFRFKFSNNRNRINSYNRNNITKSLSLFFNNWKERHPMLLQVMWVQQNQQFKDLIQLYKSKGIIKEYISSYGLEEFEWIQLKNHIPFYDF